MKLICTIILSLSSASFAADCPQQKEVRAFHKASTMNRDQNRKGIDSYEKQFAALCSIGKGYTCKTESITEEELQTVKKRKVGPCDERTYIYLENGMVNVYSFAEKK